MFYWGYIVVAVDLNTNQRPLVLMLSYYRRCDWTEWGSVDWFRFTAVNAQCVLQDREPVDLPSMGNWKPTGDWLTALPLPRDSEYCTTAQYVNLTPQE